MGRVVGDLILDARSWGAGVAAAERHAIHQVAAIHVALYAATGRSEIHFFEFKNEQQKFSE